MYSQNRNQRVRNVRMNPQPPAGATYFDPNMMVCAPCSNGSVNHCQTVPRADDNGTDGKFDWLFESARRVASVSNANRRIPVAAATVADCCTTTLDAASGMYKTNCDTSQGCGWVAGPYLTEEMSCKFTTDGATYASFDECRAANPGSGGGGIADQMDWFAPCGDDQITNCYYPSIDACMPAVFGKQRAVQPTTCSSYVCNGAVSYEKDGRIAFPSSSCRCVDK